MKPGNAGRAKGPQLKGNARSDEDGGIGVSLSTPESVQKLQTALHDKAKEAPNFRFYALYDKVYRKDVLAFAYECCKANGGAAGVDGQTFEDIEAYGEERWLDELAQELKKRTYQPLPVRRVYIPKPDGKQRPLGVPAIRDRAAQMAAVLVLGPIFEADLQPEQYAYRKDRSALDAVRHVHKLINTGHGEIVDADLSSYFDTLPHSELLKSVARRVVDRNMLHLTKMRNMMSKLKLTVNDTKTRVCKLPEEKFDFLGYTFGRCYSAKGRAYLGSSPSKKRVQRICEAISQETGRNKILLAQETVIKTLNRMMVGWANYFCLGPVSKAYRAVERHARKRLRQWLRAKHKLRGQATKPFSITTLHQVLGLVELTTRTSSFPWAKP